jgi:ketosteroid isomerase-like protein
MTNNSLKDQVKAAYEAWSAAFNKGDRKAIMSLYSDNALLHSGDFVFSGGVLEKFFDGLFAEPLFTGLTLQPLEAHANGDVIIASARWTAQGKDASGQPTTIRGTTAHVFEKQSDGSFTITLHCFPIQFGPPPMV